MLWIEEVQTKTLASWRKGALSEAGIVTVIHKTSSIYRCEIKKLNNNRIPWMLPRHSIWLSQDQWEWMNQAKIKVNRSKERLHSWEIAVANSMAANSYHQLSPLYRLLNWIILARLQRSVWDQVKAVNTWREATNLSLPLDRQQVEPIHLVVDVYQKRKLQLNASTKTDPHTRRGHFLFKICSISTSRGTVNSTETRYNLLRWARVQVLIASTPCHQRLSNYARSARVASGWVVSIPILRIFKSLSLQRTCLNKCHIRRIQTI